MARKRKRLHQLAEARSKVCIANRAPAHAALGVHPSSPLLAIAHPGEKRRRLQVKRFEPSVALRQRPRRRVSVPSTTPSPRVLRSADEEKWFIIAQAISLRDRGLLTNEKAKELALTLGLTGRSLRRLMKKVEETHSVLRKQGSGRPNNLDHQQASEFMNLYAEETNGSFTKAELGRQLLSHFGVGSKTTGIRMLEEFAWVKASRIYYL